MYRKKIKEIRIKLNMSQEELAKKTGFQLSQIQSIEEGLSDLTPVELKKFAEAFGVNIDYLLIDESTRVVSKADNDVQFKQVLTLCTRCNKPIYERNDIVRRKNKEGISEIYCKECINEMDENKRKNDLNNIKQRRICSFIFASLVFLFFLFSGIFSGDKELIPFYIVMGVIGFTFTSCLILKNNLVGDIVTEVFGWGFITLPGLIVDLSIDGLILFIVIKLVFFVLGFILAIICGLLGVVIGAIASVFAYPFALYRNLKNIR